MLLVFFSYLLYIFILGNGFKECDACYFGHVISSYVCIHFKKRELLVIKIVDIKVRGHGAHIKNLH